MRRARWAVFAFVVVLLAGCAARTSPKTTPIVPEQASGFLDD